MTRKDYIVIAEALRIQYLNAKRELEDSQAPETLTFFEGRLSGIRSAATELADSLRRDNGRFDTNHFMAVVRGEKDLTSKPRSAARKEVAA